VVKELGIDDALGNRLRDQIEAIFADNQMTPAVASTELQKLHTRLNRASAAVTQLINSFTELKIGAEMLEPEECEVGVLIPRAFVDNKLHELGEEFTKLDDLLAPFCRRIQAKNARRWLLRLTGALVQSTGKQYLYPNS
jgi:hypothetical protein